MKIVIIDTLYPRFLDEIGHLRRVTSAEKYSDIYSQLMSHRFGTSDAYSTNLKLLGHEAQELIVNSPLLQSAWANEMGFKYIDLPEYLRPSYVSRVPIVERLVRILPTLHNIFLQQIRQIKPDVAYFQDLNFIPPSILKQIRKEGILVVGQIASPLPPINFLKNYDLIFSSLPNLIPRFKNLGIRSKFLPIAFDERVLDRIPAVKERDIPLSFVGGISAHHSTTIPLLNEIALSGLPLTIYGYGKESIEEIENLKRLHKGEAWGLDMYRILSRSSITLNRHIDIAGSYANNMRLFEATGVGALLLTDKKINLSDYFEIDSEVLTYAEPREAVEKIAWAISHPDEASEIMANGQKRTLRDHSYYKCMQLLSNTLNALS